MEHKKPFGVDVQDLFYPDSLRVAVKNRPVGLIKVLATH